MIMGVYNTLCTYTSVVYILVFTINVLARV